MKIGRFHGQIKEIAFGNVISGLIIFNKEIRYLGFHFFLLKVFTIHLVFSLKVFRILTWYEFGELLVMSDALEYVEDAYRQLSLGNAIIPQRIAITDPAPGLNLIMPSIIGGEMNALATKIGSVYKHNPEKYNISTVLGKIMIQDINIGEIVGIMDGGLITAMRTGAATGVSVKYLVRNDSTSLSIFGAGTQARKQVVATYWALNQTFLIRWIINKLIKVFKLHFSHIFVWLHILLMNRTHFFFYSFKQFKTHYILNFLQKFSFLLGE
ncbi:MAG: hypothetical protein ACTSWX_01735 [Promethearchaeota archaeon]